MAGAGVDFGEFVFELSYELGMRHIRPSEIRFIPFYDNRYQNRNLALSVGFKF